MPAKVLRQQVASDFTDLSMETYDSQYGASELSVKDEPNTGGGLGDLQCSLGLLHSDRVVSRLTASASEGRARKRLQKSPSYSLASSRRIGEASSSTVPVHPSHFTNRRRQSIRDQKGPLGARPLQRSPSKQQIPNNPSIPYRSTSSSVRQVPHSRQASNNSNSAFNFGTKTPDQRNEGDTAPEGFTFLPAVSFDDFQTSIESEKSVSDSAPTLEGSHETPIRGATGNGVGANKTVGSEKSISAAPAGLEVRMGRSGSLVQRKNSTARQKMQPSFSTSRIETMGPPDGSLVIRGRRQSHFPTSVPSSASTRPPRKSVGPGILTHSLSDYATLDEALSTKPVQDPKNGYPLPLLGRSARPPASQDAGVIPRDNSLLNIAARNVKAKSLHAPATYAQDFLSASSIAPDTLRTASVSTARSPGRSNDRGTTTPSSGKRLSMMPGHATGLGARTISPTDVRRLKRLSMMPNPPPLPFTPPAPLPDPITTGTHLAADSPSLIPRKSVTPSSNRTTPDHNRKSYCSVNSTSSNTSYSSLRASANMARVQPSASFSRLPTLKSRNENLTNGAEEEVPPVPAIPKAYESPKTELDVPFFASRKSSLTLDASSTSSSTLDHVSVHSHEKEPPMPHRDARQRHGHQVDNCIHTDEHASRNAPGPVRNLQPLRLPPLNLLPLSTPTTEKIAALHDRVVDTKFGNVTPPPRRGTVKTPSTPMTASKASFFPRYQHKDDTVPASKQARSSSSHYVFRSDSSSFRAASSSSSGGQEVPDTQVRVKAVSPFVSTSLPKQSVDFSLSRPKGIGDRSFSNAVLESKPKLMGPREQTSVKATNTNTRSQPSSPMEPETHSFGRTLRRKLSLTRKRSSSKAELTVVRDSEYPPPALKHDAMPPPRLPASATWHGPWQSDASPTQKPLYLHSRRKSSNPEASMKTDRARIDGSVDALSGKSIPQSIEVSSAQNPPKGARFTGRSASTLTEINGTTALPVVRGIDTKLDRDDLMAEEEMKRLALKRKDTESAAKELDELRQRAVPKEKVSAAQALKTARLNIFERGEIIDFKEIYFCGTQTARKFTGDLEAETVNFGYDDDRGDYNIVNGDHLAYRYEVVDVLGKGSFGQVVRCVDHKTGSLVAIKIIRNKKRFHQQALVEVNILQKLREWDPQNKFSMVNFTQSFYFRGHLCISTELLGMNLYEFIKIHDFRGFSIKLIRRFTKQLLNSLVLLKSKKVIHCDMKPENILLAHPAHSEIKVIDFGSSCLENEKVYTYIQSRFYRSPEVILGMTYGMPIDMWSLGCILAELLTGYPIFPGENEQEQLACIMEVFGPPDKHLIEKSTRKKLFFDSLGKPRLTVSSKGKRRRPSSKTLQQALKCDDEAFLDFIARCLRWDPDRRLKPDEAINHEFLTGIKQPQPQPRNPRSVPSSSLHINSSPIKRYNSIHTPATAGRPLPEPPGTSLKNGTMVRNMERQNSASPIKPVVQPKRHSTMTGINGITARKGANAATLASLSSTALPRLGGPRLASGRSEMASAAAVVATSSSAKLR